MVTQGHAGAGRVLPPACRSAGARVILPLVNLSAMLQLGAPRHGVGAAGIAAKPLSYSTGYADFGGHFESRRIDVSARCRRYLTSVTYAGVRIALDDFGMWLRGRGASYSI